MADPYRTVEQPKRGPLTKGERFRLGMKGILKMEPILEQHRFGLDPRNGLPLDERVRHAAGVARSDSADNLFKMIIAEPDSAIRDMLLEGYLAAFKRTMGKLDHYVHIAETGMAGRSCHWRMQQFRERCVGQVESLVKEGIIAHEDGRKLVKAMGEPI